MLMRIVVALCAAGVLGAQDSRAARSPEDAEALGEWEVARAGYVARGDEADAARVARLLFLYDEALLAAESALAHAPPGGVAARVTATHVIAAVAYARAPGDAQLATLATATDALAAFFGAEHPRTFAAEAELAAVLAAAGRLAEARQRIDRVLPAIARVLGPDDPRTAEALYRRSDVVYEEGRRAEALEDMERARSIFAAKAPRHPTLAAVLADLATFAPSAGAREALGAEALAAAEERLGEDHAVTATARRLRGESAAQLGFAAEIFDAARVAAPSAWAALAAACAREGDAAGCLAAAGRAVKELDAPIRRETERSIALRFAVARSVDQAGATSDADRLFAAAAAAVLAADTAPPRTESAERAARALRDAGRADEAERFMRLVAERATSRARRERREAIDAARAEARRLDAAAASTAIRWLDGHVGEARAVAVSRDGGVVATAADDGRAILWSTRPPAYVADLMRGLPETPTLAVAPDGSVVLVFSAGLGRATLFDGRSGEATATLGGEDALVRAATLSPDGRSAAIVDDDGKLEIVDAADGALRVVGSGVVPAAALEWSADGAALLAYGGDGRARVLDVRTGAERAVFGGGPDNVRRASFRGSARYVAATLEGGRIAVYDVENPDSAPFTAAATTSGLSAVSESGRRIIVRERRGAATTYVVRDLDATSSAEMKGCEATNAEVAFFDGDRVVGVLESGAPRPFRRFDAVTGAELVAPELPLASKFWPSPSRRFALVRRGPLGTFGSVVSMADGRLCDGDWETGGSLWCGAISGDDRFWTAGVYPAALALRATDAPFDATRDRYFVPGARGAIVGAETAGDVLAVSKYSDESAPRPFAIVELSGVRPSVLPSAPKGWSFATARLFDGGRRVSLAGRAGLLTYERSSGKWSSPVPLGIYPGDHAITEDGRRVSAIQWARTGDEVGAAAMGVGVSLHDAADGRILAAFRVPAAPGYSPDSCRLELIERTGLAAVASIEAQGGIVLLDSESGAERARLAGHVDRVEFLVAAPDGRRLLSGGADGAAIVWDLESRKEATRIRTAARVRKGAWSADGRSFAVGGEDGVVWIAEVVGGAGRARRLSVGGRRIRALAFSPDGGRLAIGSDDGRAEIVDVATGRLVAELRGHAAAVTGAAFFDAGRRAVTTSQDGAVRIFDAETGRLVVLRLHFGDDAWITCDERGWYDASPSADERVRVEAHGRALPLSCYAKFLRSPEKLGAAYGARPAAPPPPLPRAPELELLRPAGGETDVRTLRVEAVARDASAFEAFRVEQDGAQIDEARIRAATTAAFDGKEARLDLLLEFPSEAPTTIAVRATNRRGAASPWRRATTTFRARERELYVLAIGVSDYADPALRLRFPAKDAADFAAAFKAQEGRRFARVHVASLLDGAATGAALRRLRHEYLLRARPEDAIVVLVAGHGVRAKTGDYFFLTREATAADPYDGIERSEIEALVTWPRLRARQRALFLDSCRAGGAPDDLRGVDDGGAPASTGARERRGVYVLAASASDELAEERAGNGLFTGALVAGLRGEADEDRDGLVEVEELMSFAAKRVHELSGGRQRPVLSRVEGGENFPLAAVR